MLQPGGDFDLAGEPFSANGHGEFRPEDLHRNFAMVLEVLSQIDRGHPAAAELSFERVAAGQRSSQLIEGIGHA